MKRYLYPLMVLGIALAGITGCGSNNVTSKLIGTQMATPSNIGTNTMQATVVKQVMKDTLPSVLAASTKQSSTHAPSDKASLFGTLGNKMGENGSVTMTSTGTYSASVDGGTVAFNYNNTLTLTPTSNTTGTISIVSTNLVETLTGLTVVVNGGSYKVSGTVTNSSTMSGSLVFIPVSGGINVQSLSINLSLKATSGTITIAGPGCNGTWSYSYTVTGPITWATPAANMTGQLTLTGTVGGIPVSLIGTASFPTFFNQ